MNKLISKAIKHYGFYLALAFMIILLTNNVQAIGTLGTFKLGQPINITQGCAGSTYANISIITVDGKTVSGSQIGMTSKGGGSYIYQYTPPREGYYYVLTHCDEQGVDTQAPLDFNVNASGKTSSSSNNTFFIMIIVIIYLVAFAGFFGKNIWLSMLGGMGMIALGIYTINSGVIIYRDFITSVFSWTTIGIGAIFALTAGVAFIQDNY